MNPAESTSLNILLENDWKMEKEFQAPFEAVVTIYAFWTSGLI